MIDRYKEQVYSEQVFYVALFLLMLSLLAACVSETPVTAPTPNLILTLLAQSHQHSL